MATILREGSHVAAWSAPKATNRWLIVVENEGAATAFYVTGDAARLVRERLAPLVRDHAVKVAVGAATWSDEVFMDLDCDWS